MSSKAWRPNWTVAAVDGARLTVAEFALVLVAGGSAASRTARLAALDAAGAAIVATPAEAAEALAARRLTVIDVDQAAERQIQPQAQLEAQLREALLRAARAADAEAVLLEPDAAVEDGAARRREGFAATLAWGATAQGATELEARLLRLPVDRRDDAGPFDVIGDVHGCAEELFDLLRRLGYRGRAERPPLRHPDGRRPVFVGDVCDRGPANRATLRFVAALVRAGAAEWVIGNHDHKILRWLEGHDPTGGHGFAATRAELERDGAARRDGWRRLLAGLPSHLWLDGGRLVVAHAGVEEAMHGRESARIRRFALFGATTGERDAYGLPVRLDWARDYSGSATVVHGHTPMAAPSWTNGVLCIDTGCCFGGSLTAFRWPEGEIVSVPARRVYTEPVKPLDAPRRAAR